MKARRIQSALAVAMCAASVAACNSILGFDERTFDPCVAYCDAITTTCTDAFKQYQSEDICLTTCALLEPGDASSDTGDTVACRQAHVDAASEQAAADRAEECSLAGFGGFHLDGSAGCADRCELYCAQMKEVCPSTEPGSADEEGCASLCLAVPVNPAWTPADATVKDHDNSIECRLWHLANATEGSEHCAHADGTAKCEGIAP